MTWLVIMALALAAFAVAIAALRMPRSGATLLGMALVLGLAGYAAQGSPDQPAAPGTVATLEQGTGELLVTARRQFFDADFPPSRYVITADAFARQGRWESAARFLRNAVRENPGDREAWAALGNALIEHAGGRLTPAAELALERAAAGDPGQLAPAFLRGLAALRAGDPQGARAILSSALANAPAQARGRAFLAERLAQISAAVPAK